MHTTPHDGPLTGVHWPSNRTRCRGSRAKDNLCTCHGGTYGGARRRAEGVVDVATRDPDGVVDGIVCAGTKTQQAKSHRMLECNNVNPTRLEGCKDGLCAGVEGAVGGEDEGVEVREVTMILHQLVLVASVQGRLNGLHSGGVMARDKGHVNITGRDTETGTAGYLEICPARTGSVVRIRASVRPGGRRFGLHYRTRLLIRTLQVPLDTLVFKCPYRTSQGAHQIVTRDRRRGVAGATTSQAGVQAAAQTT